MIDLYSAENKKYEVKEVPEIDLLKSLGVFDGAIITKKTTYNMGGPVLILIDSREVAIGKDTAILINVEEVNE